MARLNLTEDELYELMSKVETALMRLTECNTYDQSYVNYLEANDDLEECINTMHARINPGNTNE